MAGGGHLRFLILGLVVTVVVSVYWRRLHGEAWAEEAALMEAVDEVLADSLDDLRASATRGAR